jgi:hypothetical protein
MPRIVDPTPSMIRISPRERGVGSQSVSCASVCGSSGKTDGVAPRKVISADSASPMYAATNGTSAGWSAHITTAAATAS